jgi:hypothetical protein
MDLTTPLLWVFSLALLSYGQQEVLEKHNHSNPIGTCNLISVTISNASQVYFPRERIIISFVILKADQ